MNLAVADGSDLITAWELWSVSKRGVRRYLFLEAVIQSGAEQPATARLLARWGRSGTVCGIIKVLG